MASYVADVENNFFTLRNHQVELLDRACKNNVIVASGTRNDRTFVAVLLIKEFTRDLVIPWKEGGKRAIFLVNKVSLVEQQAVQVENHTPLNVGRMRGYLNGESGIDIALFQKFIDTNEVIVSTGSTFLDLLDRSFFDLSKAAVVVFDECHHALSDKHPYRKILQRYEALLERKKPRLLGLTASIINSKISPTILEACLTIFENVMHCALATSNSLSSLAKYGFCPVQHVVICEDYDISKYREAIICLEELRTSCVRSQEFNPDIEVDPRKPILDAVGRILSVLKQLGPWCAYKVSQLFEKQLRKLSRQHLLPTKQILFLQRGVTAVQYAKRLLEFKLLVIKSYEALQPYLPNRVQRLFALLEQYKPISKKEMSGALSGIIFVEQRYVAYALNMLIKTVAKWNKDRFGFLSSDFVIGHRSTNDGTAGSTSVHKRQEEVIRRFRHRHLNLLVATSVLEEGVEVRHCNCIIRFNRPLDYRAYIQSRGRAKKSDSNYYIFVEEKEQDDCTSDLKDFIEIEQIMMKRCTNPHNPLNSVDKVSDLSVDESLTPYVVPSTGAKVTVETAISLVNRYCAKLPSDIFTRLAPKCKIIPVIENNEIVYHAELTLPINSPIKEVVTTLKPLKNKKLAQMVVALETCKKLHQRGELSDHLIPVGKDTITLTVLDEDPDEYIPNMNYKVGSARRRRLYDKRMAKALNGLLPSVGDECYIYVMELNLTHAATGMANPKNRKIANPLDSEFCFGFLSKKMLPNIPAFPVFLRQGRTMAKVYPTVSRLRVDAEMLPLLKIFHRYLFDDVLRLMKGGLAFVPETAAVDLLIVPLRRDKEDGPVGSGMGIDSNDFKLDYTYVRNVVRSLSEVPRVPAEEDRQAFKFEPERYKDAVVTPWYRDKEHPSFYFVAEILDFKPNSKFPDEKFTNFNEYYMQKYGLVIYNQEQKLLDVDHTSSRLNLLTPRYWPKQRSSDEKKTKESPLAWIQKQILVPELVDVHPIAASLWNLVVALPTLIYRMNCLLLADELREIVVSEALELKSSLPLDHEWPPLDYATCNDDELQRPIQKIDDLRKKNEKTITALSCEDENKENVDENLPDFEIGVWDPELAKGLENATFGSDRCMSYEGFDDPDEEIMGLMSGNSTLHNQSDMSDDEDVIVFDFVNSVRERWANSNEDIFAPRENIKSCGWDDLVVLEERAPAGSELPLSVNAGPAEIDSRALMADLSAIWNTGRAFVPPPRATSSEEQDKFKGNESVTTTENANIKEGRKPQRPHLFLDPYEDTDDVYKEEVVGLIDFLDNALVLDEASQHIYVVPEQMSELKQSFKIISPSQPLKRHFSNADENATRFIAEQPKEGGIMRTASDEELLADAAQESIALQTAKNNAAEALMCAQAEAIIDAPALDWMPFSFMEDTFSSHPYGVSPCTLLQALTLSSAADGINLERLETVGDSFLKYAVTDYLFHQNPDQHEGRLSFARSKEVSNCNLYRLGKKRGLPPLIIGSKFEPADSWLPPCFAPTTDFKAPNTEEAEESDKFIEKVLEGNASSVDQPVKVRTGWDEADDNSTVRSIVNGVETINFPKNTAKKWDGAEEVTPLPYNYLTQQNLGDKSIADAVEALIGAHLLELGPSATLKFMKWFGLKVLTETVTVESPLLRFVDTEDQPQLSSIMLFDLYQRFRLSLVEETIGYHFKDKAFLLQAFTHASYYKNRITGCYQRLEFLGDAVLDYVITRFLFQHPLHYSPGVLTDLRSALVNNTIFASLAIKYGFHKHFIAMCPGLFHMIEKFVHLCKEKNLSEANFNEEMFMLNEEEIDEGDEEDIEVPKAMGDIFESVAGAVYLDSDRNLDLVWRVFYSLMKDTIEACCNNPPKSPIRELLEMEPEKARFSKLERILDTGKVRVTVDVQGKCRFIGMGRSYRIAKSTAAKRALRHLRSLQREREKNAEKQQSSV